VLFLAEALGKTVSYDNCLRTAQMDLVAVVNWFPKRTHRRELALLAALSFFFNGSNLISLEEANDLIRITWEREGRVVEPWAPQ